MGLWALLLLKWGLLKMGKDMDWIKLVVKNVEIVFLGYFLVTLNFPRKKKWFSIFLVSSKFIVITKAPKLHS